MLIVVSHNPYFNRWFSAIKNGLQNSTNIQSHNPYFNRWFSAIRFDMPKHLFSALSQSLF